jgi:hypothetical protein
MHQKRLLLLVIALFVVGVAFAADITLNYRGTLTDSQSDAIRFLWRSSGATNIPIKDFATNYVRLEVKDVVQMAREQRLARLRDWMREATDDQLDQVEKIAGVR